MRNLNTWFLLCLTVFILSCSSVYNVDYEYNEKADFTRYKSYDWLPKQSKVEIKKRIENTVNTRLEVKGYRMTRENPDFLIDMQLASREMWSRGMGGTRYRFEEEKLELRFIDAQSKNLLWKGEAMGMLNAGYTLEELDELVNKVAQEILEDFPPASAKSETVQKGASDIALQSSAKSETVQKGASDIALQSSAKSETIRTSAADITLQWDANTEPNLAGYKIYYRIGSSGPPYEGSGAAEGDSPLVIPLQGLNNPNSPQFKIHGLSKDETYYFVITAYTTDGKESGYSSEVTISPEESWETK